MNSGRGGKKGGNGGLYGARNASSINWQAMHGWSVVEEVIRWASARAGYPNDPSPSHLVDLVLEGQKRLGEDPHLVKSAVTQWRRQGYFSSKVRPAIEAATGLSEGVMIQAQRKKERGDRSPLDGFVIPGPVDVGASRRSGKGPVKLAAPDEWPPGQPGAKSPAKRRPALGSARPPARRAPRSSPGTDRHSAGG